MQSSKERPMEEITVVNSGRELLPEDPWKATEREVYQELYAASRHFTSPEVREQILHRSEDFFLTRLRAICQGARILEVGCGTGKHSILAGAFGAASVIGIDIAPAAVQVASQGAFERGLHQKVSFQTMDTDTLNFADDSFDVVINHEAFSSFNLPSALKEMCRVLSPRGVLLGIECLGHNPIFNLNRSVGVWRGTRTRWAASHVMKTQDFTLLESSFSRAEKKHFHFFLPCIAPLRHLLPEKLCKKLFALIDELDKGLMQRFLLLEPYSFKMVFECSGPLKNGDTRKTFSG